MKMNVYSILILVLLVLLISCETNQLEGTVRIGVMAAFTGKFADIGEDFKNGLEMALEDINADGKNIELVYEDHAADPKVAVQAFNKLINVDNVKVVLSGTGSSANLAVAPIAESNGIVLMSHTRTPSLIDAGEYVFMFRPLIEGEAEKISNYLHNQGYRKIGILYDSASDTQTILKDRFMNFFISLGGKIIITEGYDSKTVTDFRTILTKIKSKDPDAIYAIAIDKVAGLIVKQARELDIKAPIFGWAGYDSEPFLTIAGDLAEGIIFTGESSFTCDRDKKTKGYCGKYRNKFGGRKIRDQGVYAYDNLKILADLIKKYGNNPEKIGSEFVKVKNYDGVMSAINIDEKGNLQMNDFVLKTVRNGEIVRID